MPAEGQPDLGSAFARPGERFRGVRWSPGHGGAPLLEGPRAWISCDRVREYDGGDHTVVIGRVTALRADRHENT
ncbi:flavin reductase family protein [Streptomyces sp. NPDC058914]|uniref:flavin reductase family protein n=1 Tax=Streptomyces TaxID=1883 RepID=UPI0036C3FD03